MAITLYQAPDGYTPGYNPMWYTVSGSLNATAGYQYGFSVYIDDDLDGNFGTRKALVKIPARVDGYGVYDPHRICEDFLNTDIDATTYGFQRNLNSFAPYMVKVAEYDGTDTDIGGGETFLSSGFCFNGSFKEDDFVDYDEATYALQGNKTRRFLTNSPDSLDVGLTQNQWLYMIVDTADSVEYAEIKTYDAAGALIQTVKLGNDFSGITAVTDHFLRFGSGPNNLNSFTGTLIAGTQPIITSGTASYTVQMRDSNDLNSSEIFTYVIDPLCTKYTNFRIHFLNRLGGFDSFNFKLRSEQFAEITRHFYEKPRASLTGTTYGYSKKDRGTVQFATESRNRYRITADFPTLEEYTWLEELITSPEVYWEITLGDLRPIYIEQNNYQIWNEADDGPKVLDIDFFLSPTNQTQRF